eukprot:10050901-Lingulodinium_polyedra.AAC.1
MLRPIGPGVGCRACRHGRDADWRSPRVCPTTWTGSPCNHASPTGRGPPRGTAAASLRAAPSA